MDRRERDRLRTRSAILDAAESLMREEGYAAVTSRRVAERAGLKSQLVHYHFSTMDELFQEAYRRSDRRFFELYLKAVSSKDPLQAFWKQSIARDGSEVVSEYVAAAKHRKVLRDELVGSWSRFQLLFDTLIGKDLKNVDIASFDLSPKVLRFLLSAVAKSLTEEANLNYTEGHDEIIAFMGTLLARSKARPPSVAASGDGRPRRESPASVDNRGANSRKIHENSGSPPPAGRKG